MAAARPLQIATPLNIADPDVDMARSAIERAMTAAWLIDAVQTGDLSFVNRRDGAEEPPHGWAVQPTITGDEVLEYTRDMMLRVIGDELAAAHRALTGKKAKKGGAV